jgi:uncharacterized Zn finger protein
MPKAKCPKCGLSTAKEVKRMGAHNFKTSREETIAYYRCENCGHNWKKVVKSEPMWSEHP